MREEARGKRETIREICSILDDDMIVLWKNKNKAGNADNNRNYED